MFFGSKLCTMESIHVAAMVVSFISNCNSSKNLQCAVSFF